MKKVYEDSSETRAGDGHSCRHVLVVEDMDMVRDIVVRQVNALGYSVSEAFDGPSALEIIRKRTDIDVLFSDISLPGDLSGYDLADQAEQIRPDLRVLFTSGYSDESIGQNSRLGQRDLLQKPYRRQELASKLRKVLES